MPVHTIRIHLEGDYDGFSVVMRSNPPVRLFTEIQANQDFASLFALIQQLIIDWDLVNDQGTTLPIDELEAVPIDLFGQIVSRYLAAIADVAAGATAR